MDALNNDPLRYAGFLPRLGAILLDILILLPLCGLVLWGSLRYRLFNVYYLIPGTLFGLFYSVYLVRRFGGTPGKLIVGIRIRKLNGQPVGYREAFLRYFPDFVFCLLLSVGINISLFRLTDSEYQSLSLLKRAHRVSKLAPSWYKPLRRVQGLWLWSELLVLLTNRKKRALHDFIAGTVVVHSSSNKPMCHAGLFNSKDRPFFPSSGEQGTTN